MGRGRGTGRGTGTGTASLHPQNHHDHRSSGTSSTATTTTGSTAIKPIPPVHSTSSSPSSSSSPMEQQQQEASAQANSNGSIVHQEQTTTPQLLPNNGFSYTKFNTALNAGLLNPMSPPPLPLLDSPKPIIPSSTTRSSPTLFEMMANEQDPGSISRTQTTTTTPFPPSQHHHYTNSKNPHHHHPPPSSSLTLQERQLLLQERVAEIMGTCCCSNSPLNQHHQNHDVRLTLTSKDGLSVTMNVDRQVLVSNSRFFASKLSDHWSRQQRSLPHLVEISDCDDVEVYVETLRLMYSSDPRRRLLREDVPKVLSILKVCSAIAFEEGVVACLEYLEAAPWAEEEEEKVAELLSQLHLESSGGAVGEVLKRVVCADPLPPDDNSSGNNEETLIRLLHVVLEGKDEKARRDMKGLVSKMLRENNTTTGGSNKSNAGNDLSKDSLYSAFHNCLDHLRRRVVEAAGGELSHSAQIARQADNMHWLLDILIDRQLAEDVLLTWAGQTQLADLHRRVPAIHRYEVSRVTARLFVGVGKGQVLVPKEARWMLLKTWLEPFYEDFGWMRRACKGLDRYSVEDGLANTILTLPLPMQQEVFLAWFDRFLNSGDEYCPNLQKGFEVWWRRAFWKRRGNNNGGGGGGDGAEQLRLAMSSQ